ncbi:thiolase family protein [Phenylobacterium sp.]|uniref:thiolase family protein n=1 Tax=Phenylobacterium sp. TaxID=1871053 RepID=UPI00301E168E
MAKLIGDLRPVYVVGVGWHKYQYPTDTPYVAMGLKAVRDALADGGLEWSAVESSYIAHMRLGGAIGRAMLRHLGALGKPLVHVENASASGSTAFRHACIEVASGISDVALALGIDKVPEGGGARPARGGGLRGLADDAIVPFTSFALLTNRYAAQFGLRPEDIALVAVKNSANGALNPNAQRQQARTLEEVLGGRPISGTLTPLQCTPVGEGAAAAIVASEEGIKRLGLDMGRAVRVLSSTAGTETAEDPLNRDTVLSREVMQRSMREAGVTSKDLDVLEVHDAFTIEELLYAEATGICPEGQFIPMLKEGAFDIGGQCAISPSGGLLSCGHPIGPTGVGQIGEIVTQIRGEAGARQHKGARTGLAHMVGVGAVCYVHVLQK